jgi:hypothetical protein
MLQRTGLNLLPVLLLAGWPCACAHAQARSALPVATGESSWRFKGAILEDEDISCAVLQGDRLIIGADEGHVIQALKEESAGLYVADRSGHIVLPLKNEDEKEVDVEAMALDNNVLYVVGSHCRARGRVDPDGETVAENRKSLRKNRREESRERLYRIELNADGARAKQWVSLHDLIEDDKHLEDASGVPSKENGVDIEGLAVGGQNELLVGFRGPVFRDNYVPVMAIDTSKGFEEDRLEYELRFIDLGGRGIRAMAETEEGFLLIGGPVGSEAVSYVLYAWDGKDALPGEDADGGQHVVPLCEIPLPHAAAKAEGLHLLEETGGTNRFLVVFDGVKNGEATVFTCPRP